MAGLLYSRLYGAAVRNEEEEVRRPGGLLSSRLHLQRAEPQAEEPKPPVDFDKLYQETKDAQRLGLISKDEGDQRLHEARVAKQAAAQAAFQQNHPVLHETLQQVDERTTAGLSWVMKQLSRGTHFGTKLIDATANNFAEAAEEQGVTNKAVAMVAALPRALGAAAKEAVVQKEQIAASDLLRRGMPEWSQQHPKLVGLLGFVGDVAVDPTTYLTFGTSTAIRPAKVAVGVDKNALRKLTVEAGVNPSTMDKLAALAGKGSKQAERAMAFESRKALERAVVARRGQIVGEYEKAMQELQGAAPVADDVAVRVADPTAPQIAAGKQAQAAAEAAERKLQEFEKHARRHPVKSPEKVLAREQQRVALQDAAKKAQEHVRRVTDPVEQYLEFKKQQEMFGSRIPGAVGPKVTPEVAQAAEAVSLNRKLGAPERFARGPVDRLRTAAAEAQTAAAQTEFQARQVQHAQKTVQVQADMERKLFELDTAHKALEGRVFKSGEELSAELGKLAGGVPEVEVVWDGPYQRMARLLEDPQVLAKVRDRGGVKFAGKTVVSGDAIARAAEVTGFSRVRDLSTKFKSFLNETLPAFRSRNAPIVEELRAPVKMPDGRTMPVGEAYVEARKVYESLTDAADNLSFNDTTERFFHLAPESREKIGRLSWELDDIASGKGAAEGVASADRIKLAQERIRGANLSPEEDAAFRAYDSTMKQVAAVERELGLLEHVHDNYFARYFQGNTKTAKKALRDAQERELIEMNRGILSAQVPGGKLGAAKERVFGSIEQAQAAGYSPVFDMAASYALRLTQHRRAVAREQFRQTLFHLFPEAKEIPLEKLADGTPIGGVKLVGVPKEVARDLRFMGDGVYPQDAWGMQNLLRKYDKAMGVWRRAATVVRPNFGFRQGVSNTAQMALMHGMGALHPVAGAEALSLLAGRGKDMKVRTLLGEEVIGAQLVDEANRLGILRGVSVEGIGPGANPRYQDKLIKSLDRAALARRFGGDNAVTQGFVQFVNGSFRYTDVPAVVENWSRLTGYINGRRMGHAPEEAAKLVDKALFDYMHGLNAFETRWVKRVVPFYSYQRFALPFMAGVLAHTPGRVTNLAKTMDGFFKAWNSINSGTELNETERRVLPGWLLEQPQAFKGFNDQMKAVFNTFNNFTPLDVLNLLPTGGDGMTEQTTAEYARKVGMAQLAPWVKIPVELLMEKDSFTGRELEENGLRNLGPTDPSKAAGWLLGGVTATLTQDARMATLAGLAGWQGGEMAPDVQQKMLNLLLGWEEGIDPNTGQKTVFVSPYRFHIATSVFPTLNDALKMGRTDRSVMEKTLQTVFGIGTTTMDLAEEQEKRFADHDRAIQDKERLLNDAEERELYARAATAQQELAELLARIEKEEQAMSGEVRGAQY